MWWTLKEVEEGIIDQLFQSEYRPTVAIIELTDHHNSFAKYQGLQFSHQRVRTRMHAEGYAAFYQDRINTVFLKGHALARA